MQYRGYNYQHLTMEGAGMRNILVCAVMALLVVFCATGAWAANSQTVTVNAIVPTVSGGLTVTISKVVGTTWTSAASINFGLLALDPVNNIFTPSDKSYYAVDVGVKDNSGANWTITHTRQSLANGINNLDNNVNVTFVKQYSSTTSTVDKLVSYYNSQSVSYTKATLGNAWLRIYYGIGSGDATKPDAAGVTPIGIDKPAGTYTGYVTITITP